jgi:hypothetical protein
MQNFLTRTAVAVLNRSLESLGGGPKITGAP